MTRAGVVLALSGILVAGSGVGPSGTMTATAAETLPKAEAVVDAIQPDLDPKIVALLNAISEDRSI